MSAYEKIIAQFSEKNHIGGLNLAFNSLDERQIIDFFKKIKMPEKNDLKKHLLFSALDKQYFIFGKIILNYYSDHKTQNLFLQNLINNDTKAENLDFFLKNIKNPILFEPKILNACFLISSQINTEKNAILLLKNGFNPFLEDKNNYNAFDLSFMHLRHFKTFKYILEISQNNPEYKEKFLKSFNSFKNNYLNMQQQANTITGHILKLKETPINQLTPQEEKLLEAEALYEKLTLSNNQHNQKVVKSIYL